MASKNHIFGLGSTHYEQKYYLDKTNQLNDIINRNLLYSDEFNRNKRFLDKQEVLNNLKGL